MWSLFFFFKQKTAYEMRISDWSSDVCSSDLNAERTAALSIFVCDTKYSPTTVLDVDGARALSSSFQQVVGPNPCPMTTGAFMGRWGLTQPEVDRSPASDRQSRSEARRVGKECVSKCSSRGPPYPHNNNPPTPTP